MPRRRRQVSLHVYLNNRRVGDLLKHASGAIEFRYHQDWLDWEHAISVSLSLPLRHDPYRGEPVVAVFENLLPDRDPVRRRIAESVENEYWCLKLLGEFGLPVSRAQMHTFGRTKALVVERFDRRWTADGRLLRLPQEDCCQALSVPPTHKYETDGGPGMVDILKLLVASDTPLADQDNFLRAQVLFWLIGASDGHGKNFSVFLRPGGRFGLTPLYDVLTAQPGVHARQVERKRLRLAMSVGARRHYRMSEIQGRHFMETAASAGIGNERMRKLLEGLAEEAPRALTRVQAALPAGFPETIHTAVQQAMLDRLRRLAL